MWRVVMWRLAVMLCLLPVSAQAADDPAARKLLDEVTAKNAAGFQTGQSKTAITLRLANGKEKTWQTLSRAARFGGKLRTRVTFLEPADDRGVELLIVEEQKGRSAQYLWLPKMRRLRPVGGSQKSQPFMGTDFSFGDLEGAGLQAGEARKLGNETVAGAACSRIEALVADADSPYGKLMLWIDDKLAVPRKIEFHDKAAKLLKTMLVDQIEVVDGRAVLRKFRMQNHERGSTTTVETSEVDTKTALPEAVFQQDALGR